MKQLGSASGHSWALWLHECGCLSTGRLVAQGHQQHLHHWWSMLGRLSVAGIGGGVLEIAIREMLEENKYFLQGFLWITFSPVTWAWLLPDAFDTCKPMWDAKSKSVLSCPTRSLMLLTGWPLAWQSCSLVPLLLQMWVRSSGGSEGLSCVSHLNRSPWLLPLLSSLNLHYWFLSS